MLNLLLLILDCCELTNWSDPKTTGLVLATINLIFFSSAISGYSLVSVVAYLLLIFVIVSIIITKTMQNPGKE